MTKNRPIILAFDPGTHELGYAVLRGAELLFYGVKTVTNRNCPLGVLETVSGCARDLVQKYRPSILAVEKMFVTQKNSALLVVVAEQLKAVAKEAALPICEYAPKVVRKRLCRSGKATKRETAGVLADRFPELRRYYRRTSRWEMDYYGNLFDAVAVGLICHEELAGEEAN
jgi:crossover junction endodeoxyribonuclease RuvC